jgi:phosphatidylglycerophosphatase GEP4
MSELKSNIDNVIILSNSAGSSDDKNYTQLESIESNLQIKVFKHTQKKPLGGDEINAAYPHLKPSEIAMVGDRLLTDIMFANLNGYLGIHTQKVLSLKGDNWFAIKVKSLMLFLCD